MDIVARCLYGGLFCGHLVPSTGVATRFRSAKAGVNRMVRHLERLYPDTMDKISTLRPLCEYMTIASDLNVLQGAVPLMPQHCCS
jgi:hypothetical protein